METITIFISLFLMIVVIFDLTASFLLIKGATETDYSITALNERAFVAANQGAAALLLAILGANRIFDWHLPEVVVLLILSAALMIGSLPSMVWLFLYFTGRFRGKG